MRERKAEREGRKRRRDEKAGREARKVRREVSFKKKEGKDAGKEGRK